MQKNKRGQIVSPVPKLICQRGVRWVDKCFYVRVCIHAAYCAKGQKQNQGGSVSK